MREVSHHLSRYVDELAAAQRWTYRASNESATEPAAWAALALAAHGRHDASLRPARWLASLQQAGGQIGVSSAESTPCWPTGLALLAWTAVTSVADDEFRRPIERARSWALSTSGKTAPRSSHIGHDTELAGWSWAADTHSWLEPSCMFVLGLGAAGEGQHPRVRDGVRLIADRLLPAGGGNYGNTIVLGQPLLPHIQPTGLAMLALGGEPIGDPRVARSLDYLATSINARTSAPSLAMALLGLSAHGRRPPECNEWVRLAFENQVARPLAAFEKSLLLLAAAPTERLVELGLAPPELS